MYEINILDAFLYINIYLTCHQYLASNQNPNPNPTP